jgi:hypothetical protein
MPLHPSGLFPSGFPTNTVYAPFLFPIHATCPTILILLDLITQVGTLHIIQKVLFIYFCHAQPVIAYFSTDLCILYKALVMWDMLYNMPDVFFVVTYF